MYRPLARDNPAYQPNLAGTLTNVGIRLGGLGRDSEALAVTEEAVSLYRPLARDNPAHQPNLAIALGNLGVHMGRMGRDSEALATTDEALGLWRALARSDPDQYQAIYNRELALLRRDLHMRGQDTASIRLHLDDASPD